MICIQCGQVVNDGTKFCRFCGSPLTGDVQAQVPQPVPQPQTYSPVPQPVQYQIPVSSAVPGYTGYARPQVEKKPKSKFSLKNPGTILTLLGCILIVAACILPVEYAKTRRITVNKSLLFDSKAWMLHFFAVALILSCEMEFIFLIKRRRSIVALTVSGQRTKLVKYGSLPTILYVLSIAAISPWSSWTAALIASPAAFESAGTFAMDSVVSVL